MKEQNADTSWDKAVKIYYYAQLIEGYCANAGGEAAFVDCIESIMYDVKLLALDLLDNL